MGFFSKLKAVIMKSTATKLATAALAVAVLGGGVAGIVYASVVNSAEAVVGRAFLAAFSQGESSGEEVFGFRALTEALHAQGTELGLEAVVEEIPLDIGFGSVTIPNVGASLVIRTDTAKESNVDLEVKVANTSLLSGKVYADAKQMQLTVPKLLNSTLAVNYGSETFKEDLKNSYLVDYAGIPQETLDKVLEHFPEQSKMLDMEKIQKDLLEMLLTSISENFAEVELEKAGKTELSQGDEVWNCKVYTSVVYKGYVSDFLYDYSFAVKNYVKELAAEYGLDETEVEYAFYSIDKVIHEIRGFITDVTVALYIHEERLVKLTAKWGMDWTLAETEEGSLEVTLAKEGNPVENMQMALVLPIHQDANTPEVPRQMELDYGRVTKNTEDIYSSSWEIVCNEKPMSLLFEYEKLDGEFELLAKNDIQSLEVNGVINELEKGRKISLEVDDYTYKDGDYTEEQKLNISLDVKVLEETVTPLDGEPLDVLAMTEADFEKLGDEIMNNVYKLAFSMLGLFQ